VISAGNRKLDTLWHQGTSWCLTAAESIIVGVTVLVEWLLPK
jgi:hypothetical protein